MKNRTAVYVLLSSIIALFLVIILLIHHTHKKAKQVHFIRTSVVVGIQSGTVSGTLLQPGMLFPLKLPVSKISKQDVPFSKPNEAQFFGAMLKKTIADPAPLTDALVIKPGDHGFLAAVLRPGDQAMTISVDAVTDSAGLIWPGDKVDVILTQTVPKEPKAGYNLAAERVLRSVKIIATGQSIVHKPATENHQAIMASTVTLEVTPKQAEKLAISEHLGPLSLAVLSAHSSKSSRSVKKHDEPVWAYQVSKALVNNGKDSKSITIFTTSGQQGFNVQ